MIDCPKCKEKLIWGGDHDNDNTEYSIMRNFSCPKCNITVLLNWGEKYENKKS
tara:strand:- start:706 stop:864 length:159 start_codon:yes stop_codon:yes gene_type:complete